MNIFIPFTNPSLFLSTITTEYFGATLLVLILLVFCCGYLLWRNQKNDKDGKSIFLYLVIIVLMLLLFTVVSIKDEHNDYDNIPECSSVDYDIVVNKDRIYIYEKLQY